MSPQSKHNNCSNLKSKETYLFWECAAFPGFVKDSGVRDSWLNASVANGGHETHACNRAMRWLYLNEINTWQWHHFITMIRLHYNPIITPSQWNDCTLTIRKLKYHNALSAHSYEMSTRTTLSITSLNLTKSKNTTLLELWKIECIW